MPAARFNWLAASGCALVLAGWAIWSAAAMGAFAAPPPDPVPQHWSLPR